MLSISNEELLRLKNLAYDRGAVEALKKFFLVSFIRSQASAEEIHKLSGAFTEWEGLELPVPSESAQQVAL